MLYDHNNKIIYQCRKRTKVPLDTFVKLYSIPHHYQINFTTKIKTKIVSLIGNKPLLLNQIPDNHLFLLRNISLFIDANCYLSKYIYFTTVKPGVNTDTRRFNARPSLVALLAFGASSPRPLSLMRFLAIAK